MTSRFTGRFYMLPNQVQQSVSAAYDAIDEFEELVKPSFVLKEPHAFPPDKVELVNIGKAKVKDAVGQALLELFQVAYPVEWNSLVDAIRRGKAPPNLSG